MESPSAESHNPLLTESEGEWDRVIESIGPASVLVLIQGWMGDRLREEFDPQDVYQETLLHVWRDRARFEWRGLAAFRAWFLAIAKHRIRDMAVREGAAKRGGDGRRVDLRPSDSRSDGGREFLAQLTTTTAGRVAEYREQARIMQVALESLPESLRNVVRLRLFEELSSEEVAAQLGLGLSAVKHRFLKGARIYRQRLKRELASSSMVSPEEE